MTDTDTDLVDVVAPAESHENKVSGGTEAENIKALRRQRDELREQNLWLQQQAMNNQSRFKAPAEEVEESYDFNQLEQENFPDGKNLAKAFKTLDKRLKSYDQKLTAKDQKIAVLEAAMQHKDFNDVVTTENIKKYIESDEDNLESVRKADNPGLKIYNLIRKSHSYQSDLKSKKPTTQEEKRVEDKEGKPKTTSIGLRSEAVGVAAQISNSKMTREQRNALWKETQSAARR